MKAKLIILLLCSFLLVAGLIVFLKPELAEPSPPQQQKITLPSLQEQLGQNLVVGFEKKEIDQQTKEALEYIKPAGIILYYRNFENPDQFKKLISELQKIARDTTGKPYFIMLDEEPGGAARLGVFNNVFAFGEPDWDHIEKGIKIMKDLGINVDLAPIADFPFDNNSFIKNRVPAHDTEHLMEFNRQFIALLNKYNMSATLKHFPGMGVFVDDPHRKLPNADPEDSIIEKSLKIFKDGIDSGTDFVMTGHGIYDDIDPNIPATLSKKIATDLLQIQLGFKGLIITDDLSEMYFIPNGKMNLVQATESSFKAGHNLVMFSHGLENIKKIFDEIISDANQDENLQSVIATNYTKVLLMKYKLFPDFVVR
ncbi:MAG: glycoside hydrolase family 3 N-terminal domain-containing protein [Patescibacteria group bacterium]|nr:glycoside hydrolase family 3 N-terminal domain-containing protein [Patescibacteria group bacterium]